ncbi:MAG: DNA-directed RNA polymerase subunit omega [Bacillota bacterium]
MQQPSLEILMEKVKSKYSLVVIAAKRARQITEEHNDKDEVIKPVTQALFEIAENKIEFQKP